VDKVITTTLLIAVSMVMALVLFNIAYPAIVEGGDAISSMANRVEDRMKTQIAIIHTAGELDDSGAWQDTNGNGDFEVFIWVKNVGTTRILALERSDVFFGPEGNFVRIPHQSAAGGAYPYWTGQVEGDNTWSPTTTVKITIHFSAPLAPGRYFSKVTVLAGVSDDYIWSM
jgi:archaellum component FlaG (FlaF/FlaG flagellin family)